MTHAHKNEMAYGGPGVVALSYCSGSDCTYRVPVGYGTVQVGLLQGNLFLQLANSSAVLRSTLGEISDSSLQSLLHPVHALHETWRRRQALRGLLGVICSGIRVFLGITLGSRTPTSRGSTTTAEPDTTHVP